MRPSTQRCKVWTLKFRKIVRQQIWGEAKDCTRWRKILKSVFVCQSYCKKVAPFLWLTVYNGSASPITVVQSLTITVPHRITADIKCRPTQINSPIAKATDADIISRQFHTVDATFCCRSVIMTRPHGGVTDKKFGHDWTSRFGRFAHAQIEPAHKNLKRKKNVAFYQHAQRTKTSNLLRLEKITF